MKWRELYQSRISSADEAVRLITSNNRVALGHAAGEPTFLLDTLVKHKENYENVELIQMVPMGNQNYVAPGVERHLKLNGLFLGGITRVCVREGRGDFTPCYFYQVPELFAEMLPLDVAMIQVSAPDENGYVSLGVSVDYTKAAAEHANVVIAEVNDQMPRTLGDCFLHVSQIDCFVENSHPVTELPLPRVGETELAIGRNCAELVADGDTLQLGIGAIPDAVLKALSDKKDLGIHSEMISDGVVELVEAGVITNRKKSLNKGKSVAAFLMGTKRLYDFVHNNPAVSMMPVDYVNNPVIIGQNDNLISINSCVQVDLMGQVCAESVGTTQISGVGGQVDFIRGARMSKGGKSIIAIPSTAAKGNISKIVPMLAAGVPVTTSRMDVDYIVTEYGIARLRGKSLKMRARALIEIAHPDFREDLVEYYEKQFCCCYE